MNDTIVAVSSRSFSRNEFLREHLLACYPNARFNDEGLRLSREQLIHFFNKAEKIIIGLEKIDEDLLTSLPELKVVSKVGVGLDKIDLAALARRNIALANTPGVNKRAVAELVLALTLNLLRHLRLSNHRVMSGKWEQDKGVQLAGRTVGIIGFGAIGQEVAKIFRALGCNCLYYDPITSNSSDAESCENLDELLKISDIVSLHLPLNEQTHYILNQQKLALMKSSAILVNTARGGLVDEAALKQQLKSAKLSAAAIDVFEQEPPHDVELLHLPNFFATAHIGGSTEEAIIAMGMQAIAGLETAKVPFVEQGATIG